MAGDDEDAALMARVAKGDQAAFALLFDRHQQSVVRFAVRFVGERAQAEELAQEVFLKLFRSAGSYRPTAKFRTFLFRVTSNTCLNALRRPQAKRETTVAGRDDGAQVDAREPSGPDQALEAKQVEAAVGRALAAMSERERAAFCMCRFEGLAYKDIADALSATEAAVKSLIHRATLTVARHLEALNTPAHAAAGGA